MSDDLERRLKAMMEELDVMMTDYDRIAVERAQLRAELARCEAARAAALKEAQDARHQLRKALEDIAGMAANPTAQRVAELESALAYMRSRIEMLQASCKNARDEAAVLHAEARTARIERVEAEAALKEATRWQLVEDGDTFTRENGRIRWQVVGRYLRVTDGIDETAYTTEVPLPPSVDLVRRVDAAGGPQL